MYYRHPPNSMRVGTLSSSESYFQYLKKDQAHIMLSINMYWVPTSCLVALERTERDRAREDRVKEGEEATLGAWNYAT